MHRFRQYFHIYKRKGAALMLMLTLMVITAASMLLDSLSRSASNNVYDQQSSNVLSVAKQALIADAVSQSPIASAGYLRLPDLGFQIGMVAAEGSAAPNFSGNSKDYTVIGKLPWRTLGLPPLRDGQGECPWYIVSGRFKNTPATDALNWDTQGQLNLAEGNGNIIASNLAALVVAPGQALDKQNRTLSDPAYVQCGGNYDARNYLDPYVLVATSQDSAAGTSNYFVGSSNGRVALNTANYQWVMSIKEHYNDRFLSITTDEIFRVLTRRADFSTQVSALLNDAYFQSAVISGSKGSDKIVCSALAVNNRAFCNNWKEMLLLTQLPYPAPITIDGTASPDCTRVLIFGGQKNGEQLRLTATNKASPSNYLEGSNQSAFAAPVAVASNFTGVSTFNAKKASADIVKCIQ